MSGGRSHSDAWSMISRKIAFFGGLIGLAYETVFENVDRPWLFLAFLSMMGLAQFGHVFDLVHRTNGIQIGGTIVTPSGTHEEGPS